MKRSKIEIYAEILQVIDEGCHKPTIEALRVENEGKRKRYFVTEKGREILRQYKQLAITLRKN